MATSLLSKTHFYHWQAQKHIQMLQCRKYHLLQFIRAGVYLQLHSHPHPARSVIIPNSADLQRSAVARCPAPPPSFTPSAPLTVCPALLRAALLGEGGRRRCCCSAALMPVVTDLEYDAFVMGQPPHSQQILVVYVTPPLQPVNTHAASDQDVLEQLYRRRNRHRTTPCTQVWMLSLHTGGRLNNKST